MASDVHGGSSGLAFFLPCSCHLFLFIVQILPPAVDWQNQSAYERILGFIPRIVLASLLAYFAGEFSNSIVLSRLKILTRGKYLWTRTIGSTIIGEGIDTMIFCTIAFSGILPKQVFWQYWFPTIFSNVPLKSF